MKEELLKTRAVSYCFPSTEGSLVKGSDGNEVVRSSEGTNLEPMSLTQLRPPDMTLLEDEPQARRMFSVALYG